MQVGDLVTFKTYGPNIKFCIIDFGTGQHGECIAVLKALYKDTFIIRAPLTELENVLPQGKL